MLTRIISAFAVLVMSSSAFAEGTCAPEKLAAAIDRYTNEPYSAGAWRKMRGLGDPAVEDTSFDSSNWKATEDWNKQAGLLAPNVTAVQNAGYDCRMAYPLQILNARVASFGATAPYVKQWIMAQAPVIAACSGTENANLELPQPLSDQPSAIMALQIFDRDYQAASVAFYKDKSKAVGLFRKIAASQSPHKAYARYNIANLLANGKDIAGARLEANQILADVTLINVHSITKQLLGYISNIEDTPAGWTELLQSTLAELDKPEAVVMASDSAKANYTRAISDVAYGGITAKETDWWVRGELPANPTLSKAIFDISRQSAMATWMMAGQSVTTNYDNTSWAMNGDKWNGWAASYIDRAKALVPQPTGLSTDVLDVLKAKPDDASRSAVWAKANVAMAAAAKSCGDAPETAAAGQLLWHAVRLSAIASKFDEVFDGLLASPLKSSKLYTEKTVRKLASYILATGNVEQGRRLRDKILTPEFYAAIPAGERDGLKAQYSNFLSWLAINSKVDCSI